MWQPDKVNPPQTVMLCGLNGASDNSYVKVLVLAAVKAQQD